MNRFQNYEGITRAGVWVLVGVGLSALTIFFAAITLRALGNTVTDQSVARPVLTKRISILASFNLCLAFGATLSFIFAAKSQSPTTKFLFVTGILFGMTILALFLYQAALDRRRKM
jgi:hypothetical protein